MKPPLKARAPLAALVVAIFLSGAARGADDKDVGTDDPAIGSVVKLGDTVMASTAVGFYRASLTGKTWQKMDAPDSMTPGGHFIRQDAAAHVAAYYHGWNVDWRAKSEKFADLFVSKDGGKTWIQTSKGHRFTAISIRLDGTFLAIEQMTQPDFTNARSYEDNQNCHVFASQDMGATWKDVSANLPGKIQFYKFIQDPGHPGRIAIFGNDISSGGLGRIHFELYETDPAAYNWVAADEYQVVRMLGLQNLRSYPWSFGNNEQYSATAQPRLSNFFTPAFLNRDDLDDLTPGFGFHRPIAAFEMETGKTTYTFRKDEPKIIPVKVQYLAEKPEAKLLDNKDEKMFWAVGMVSYGKERGFDPENLEFNDPKRKEATEADRHAPGLITVQLDPKHPYERDIDLAKLHDFSKPGIYRIQLYHSDAWLEGWGGSFGSPVIDVTITE